MSTFVRTKQLLKDIKVLSGDPSALPVRLIGVSKRQSVLEMREALEAGLSDFGESYLQEAERKLETAFWEPHSKPKFHFVGALQSNKAAGAVSLFDCIHSVDRFKLAKAISNQALKLGKVQDVLLQVNISGEGSKSGVEAKHLLQLSYQVRNLPAVRIVGLMCIGMAGAGKGAEEFREMSVLRDKLQESGLVSAVHLSMGMSSDYRLAIACGATMVRVGTSLFGGRQ